MSKRTFISAVTLFAAAATFAAGASAHHSHAMYEPAGPEGEVTITGTVTDYQWVNPHVWVYIEVAGEAGATQAWVLESGSPVQLSSRGWRADSMKPGDTITATVRRLKDGSYGGLLGSIELSDGTILDDPG